MSIKQFDIVVVSSFVALMIVASFFVGWFAGRQVMAEELVDGKVVKVNIQREIVLDVNCK